MALLGLHECLYKEISCTPWLTLITGIPIRKGSRKIRVFMRIFPTRKDLLHQETNVSSMLTIKAPKPSDTKVHIIYPISGTLELWKFFNLTFRGYLAGTTLVLSARFSLFLFHSFCLEHVRTMWLTNDFWHHQLAPFYGNENNNNHITTSQTKSSMVLIRSMTTNNHTGEEPCTTALER